MNLLLVTDSGADEETADPPALNAWNTITLEKIHDPTDNSIGQFVTFSKIPFGKTEKL